MDKFQSDLRFEDKGKLGVDFCSNTVLVFYYDLTFTDFQTGLQKLGVILENNEFQKIEVI